MAFKVVRKVVAKFEFHWVSDEGKPEMANVVATFKTMPRKKLIAALSKEVKKTPSSDEALLNLILVDLSGIDIESEAGKSLAGKELVDAAKQDAALSARLCLEYKAALEGNERPAT